MSKPINAMPFSERTGTGYYVESKEKDCQLYYQISNETNVNDTNTPTVVFIHGAGGNAAIWLHQHNYFASTGRAVISIDCRGFGRSKLKDNIEPRVIEVSKFPSDLICILDHAKCTSKVILICQSMGGWVGLPFTLQYPERTFALCMSGTPGGIASEKCMNSQKNMYNNASDERKQLVRQMGVAAVAMAPEFSIAHPVEAALYVQISKFNGKFSLNGMTYNITKDMLYNKIKCPVHFINGQFDAFWPPEVLRDAASMVPNSTFYEKKGSGHSVYWEFPNDFNNELKRWFNEIRA